MTEFGQARLGTLLRARLIVLVSVLLALFVQQLEFARAWFWLLVVLLAADALITVTASWWIARIGSANTVRVFLALDLIIIVLSVFVSGGVGGGLAALYAISPFMAFLLLGRNDAIRFTLAGGICFLIQIILDLNGVQAVSTPPPLWISVFGQGAIVVLLLTIVFIFSVVAHDLTRQLHHDKEQAEAARKLAEKSQQRWALVNNVAWRVQEATTPQQVFATIGEELERSGMHCAVWEWAQPGATMRITYISLAPEHILRMLSEMHTDASELQIDLRQAVGLAAAVNTRTTILMDDPLTPIARVFPNVPNAVLADILKQSEMGALVFAPMVYADQVNGALMVYANALDASDTAPLAALANQAASAIEKARLLSEQRKRAAQLEIVSSLSAHLGSSQDFSDALKTVVERVSFSFGYHAVSFFDLDAARKMLHLRVGAGRLVEHLGGEYAQTIEHGILGLVARTGELYLARNTKLDANYLDVYKDHDPANSELAIPLKQGSTVFGVLDVQSTQVDAFDAGDIKALGLLAEQIGSAMLKHNALAAEQKRAAHLTLVSQITARTTLYAEPETIIRTLVELIQQRFGYHHVCFSVYDALLQEMELRAVAGTQAASYHAGERWSALKGLVGLAARTAQTIVSGDVQNDSRYMPELENGWGAKAELCVPFVAADRVLGVLDIESLQYDAFDSSDIGAMETLAGQMAVALERASSFQSERRRSAQMALVNRIASRTARLVPVRDLVREAAELIKTEFGYFNVAVFEYSTADAAIRLIANVGAIELTRNDLAAILKQGIVHTVATSGVRYLAQDTRTDATYHSPFPPDTSDPVQSEIALPLRHGTNVIGVLDIQSERRNEFSLSDVTALEILADQLATALENARLYESEARRVAQLEAVRLVALELTAERDLDALLRSIMSNSIRLANADGGTLDLVDEARGELVVYLSQNLPQDYVGKRFRIGQGLAGTVALRGKPLIVNDYARWEKRLPEFPIDEFAGMMAVPLKWQTRVLGIIGLHRRRGYKSFDEQDLHLVSLFAAQAAIALENANLFDALQARLRAQRVLTVTSGNFLELTEPHAISDRAVEAALGALNSGAAFLFLQNAQGELNLSARAGNDAHAPEEQALPHGLRALIQSALETCAPAFRHTADDTDAPASLSLLAVPMQMRERVVGVLAVAGQNGRKYNASDAESLALLANQTANALERANLFRQEQLRAHELNLLFESFRATASTLEPKQVIERLLAQLVRALNVTSGYYVQIDAARRELIQGHSIFTDAANDVERIPGDQILSFDAVPGLELLLQKQVVVIQRDDDDITEERKAYFRANNVQTILRVPLTAGERVLGYVSLWETRAPRQWDAHEIRFVETMASQATVALVNAELYQAAQNRSRELWALYEAGRLLNASLELRAICENSVEALRNILGYTHVSVYFLENEMLELQVERGYGEKNVLRRISVTQGVMARAVLTRETIFLPDVSQMQDVLRALPDLRSEIAVPLLAGERVLGVLNVETVAGDNLNGRRDTLTSEDVTLLNTFAYQLVAAIENANLYQDAQRRLHETETLFRYARELGGTWDVETLGARALDAVARLMDFDIGEVALVRESDRALVPLVARGFGAGASAPQTLAAGVGIMGWVAEHGRAVRVSDVTQDPRYVAASEHIMSEICVPLRAGERAIGVLNLEAKAPDAFDAHAEQLLTVFANQLAIAIENARLYEQTKRDAEIKAVLLRELSHRVKNNLAAITSLLYMAQDEPQETRGQILNETLGRVQSMATAHTVLAHSADGHVDLLDMGAQVLKDTVRNLAPPDARVQIETAGDHVEIALRQLTTLALVLNELATNTIRHGWDWSQDMPFVLRFTVARDAELVTFTLQDNGKGMGADFHLDSRAGLGLSLVRSLVEKDLHGVFGLARREGWTSAEVRFRPEKDTV